MREIDEMDILGYLRVRAWHVKREQRKKQPVKRYIDEVWPTLKP